MSFRIDLTFKDNVHIFLVVVRNQININFTPDTSTTPEVAFTLRKHFHHLLTHFKLENQEDAVRGADPEHIKRHHGYAGENEIVHLHIGFNKDVTPDMLQQFFKGILQAQVEHPLEKHYQFLNQPTVDSTLMAFNVFYKGFIGSSLQEQFLADRQLSKSEKQSLAQHAAQEGTLSNSDKEELKKCGINTNNITPRVQEPMFTMGLFMKILLLGELEKTINSSKNGLNFF